jgi:hypothetical protein
MVKSVLSSSIFILMFLFVFACTKDTSENSIKINCIGIEKLDHTILNAVINPFSKEEKTLSESTEGGEALCGLIDFLNQQLDKQDSKESKDIVAINLAQIAQNRNQILKKKILKEKIENVDQFAKQYVGHYQSSDKAADVVLQIFLSPTCSKCGKFLQQQIKMLIKDWEGQKEKLGLKIILHPYVTTHLLETEASKAQDQISAYWQQLNDEKIVISMDQWYEWYDLVVSGNQTEYLKDPITTFKKIFKIETSQDETQKTKWNAKTKEIVSNLLLKDNEVAPIILINHQMWHNYKTYPITYEHIIDLIKNQKLFDQQK